MHSHGSTAAETVLIMRRCAPRPKTDAARNVNSKHHFHSVTDGFFMDKDDDASEADLNPPPPLCNRKWSYLCLVSVIRHGLEIPTRASQVQYFCRQAVIRHNFRVVPRSVCNRLVSNADLNLTPLTAQQQEMILPLSCLRDSTWSRDPNKS